MKEGKRERERERERENDVQHLPSHDRSTQMVPLFTKITTSTEKNITGCNPIKDVWQQKTKFLSWCITEIAWRKL